MIAAESALSMDGSNNSLMIGIESESIPQMSLI